MWDIQINLKPNLAPLGLWYTLAFNYGALRTPLLNLGPLGLSALQEHY
jgi:hypothetical protein